MSKTNTQNLQITLLLLPTPPGNPRINRYSPQRTKSATNHKHYLVSLCILVRWRISSDLRLGGFPILLCQLSVSLVQCHFCLHEFWSNANWKYLECHLWPFTFIYPIGIFSLVSGPMGNGHLRAEKHGMPLILPYFAAFFDSSVFSVVSLISLFSAVFTCSGCSTGPTKDCLTSETWIKQIKHPMRQTERFIFWVLLVRGISSYQDSSIDHDCVQSPEQNCPAGLRWRHSPGCAHNNTYQLEYSSAVTQILSAPYHLDLRYGQHLHGITSYPLRSLHCHSRLATPNQHQPLCSNQWLGWDWVLATARCLQLLTCDIDICKYHWIWYNNSSSKEEPSNAPGIKLNVRFLIKHDQTSSSIVASPNVRTNIITQYNYITQYDTCPK